MAPCIGATTHGFQFRNLRCRALLLTLVEIFLFDPNYFSLWDNATKKATKIVILAINSGQFSQIHIPFVNHGATRLLECEQVYGMLSYLCSFVELFTNGVAMLYFSHE